MLRVYDYNNTRSATAFLDQVRQKLPVTIQQIDNDSSFGPQFTHHLADLGIHHRRIPPGVPEVNGKVERSHKTDPQQFYDLNRFRDRKDLTRNMRRWEHEYNEDAPSSCPRGHDSRRACSPMRSTIQTCQESLLTNTKKRSCAASDVQMLTTRSMSRQTCCKIPRWNVHKNNDEQN